MITTMKKVLITCKLWDDIFCKYAFAKAQDKKLLEIGALST